VAFEVPTRTHGEPAAYRRNSRFFPCIGLWPGQTGPIGIRVIAVRTTAGSPSLVVRDRHLTDSVALSVTRGHTKTIAAGNPVRTVRGLWPLCPLDLRLKSEVCAPSLYHTTKSPTSFRRRAYRLPERTVSSRAISDRTAVEFRTRLSPVRRETPADSSTPLAGRIPDSRSVGHAPASGWSGDARPPVGSTCAGLPRQLLS